MDCNVEKVKIRMGELETLNGQFTEDSSTTMACNTSCFTPEVKNPIEKPSRTVSCEVRSSNSTYNSENRCVSSPVQVQINVNDIIKRRQNLNCIDLSRWHNGKHFNSGIVTADEIISDKPAEYVITKTTTITDTQGKINSTNNNGYIKHSIEEDSSEKMDDEPVTIESERTQTLRRLKSSFLSQNMPQNGKSDPFARFGVRSSVGAENKSSIKASILIHKFPFAEPFRSPDSVRTEQVDYSLNT